MLIINYLSEKNGVIFDFLGGISVPKKKNNELYILYNLLIISHLFYLYIFVLLIVGVRERRARCLMNEKEYRNFREF